MRSLLFVLCSLLFFSFRQVAELKALSFGLHFYCGILCNIAGKNLFREVVQQVSLYGAFDGACSKLGVKPCFGNELYSLFGYDQIDVVLLQRLCYSVCLQAYNLLNLLLVKLCEHYRLVDTVQELGAYVFLQHLHYLLFGLLNDILSVAWCYL